VIEHQDDPLMPLDHAALPTEHAPGSAGKLAVLISRFAYGLPLFQSGDAKPDLGTKRTMPLLPF
jgi:hypothetical protein